MAAPRPHYDRYGRPLPMLVPDAPPRDRSDSEANVAERARILRRVETTLEEQYAYLLRSNVSAEVTISFRVVEGTIQGDLYVGILRLYRPDED